MFNKYLLLSFSLLLVNCKNSNKEVLQNDSFSDTIIKPEMITYNPIFIGLSPKMSDEEFTLQIQKLNDENKLVDKKFPLTIGKDNYLFEIIKKVNSITLKYSEQESESFNDVNYEISDNHLAFYNDKKATLIDIFNSKYKLSQKQIPENINLENYFLEKDNYSRYEDEEKTILVGYRIIGDRYPSLQERQRIEREKKEKTPKHPLENIGDFIPTEKSNSYALFGIEVEINYYHKNDFESIFNSMQIESKKNTENENRINKTEKERKNNSKSNINEL